MSNNTEEWSPSLLSQIKTIQQTFTRNVKKKKNQISSLFQEMIPLKVLSLMSFRDAVEPLFDDHNTKHN